MKVQELNAIMESIVFEEIKNSILMESYGGVMEKYHVTCEGEPVVNCDTQEEAEEHVDKLEKEHPGKQFIIEKAKYESHGDMIEKLDKMGEELEETENMKKNTKNLNEGLSEKGKMKLKEMCDTIGCRKTANKLIDHFLNKLTYMSSSDLADTAIFADGLDDVEALLEEMDFDGAFDYAEQVANDMLEDEGFDNDMFEQELKGGQKKLDKNHNGKIDGQDFKILNGQKKDTKEEEECDECWGGDMKENLKGGQTKLDKNKNGKIDAEDFKLLKKKDVNEGEMCNECGGYMNEDGSCGCGKTSVNESKKKTLHLTESELVKLIGKMVSEAAVPGIETQKKVRSASGKENNANLNDVNKKIKGQLEIPGGTNPEFPKSNKKGEKVVNNNTEKEDEFVNNFRGGTLLDLDYDSEPSEQFKARLKKALDGDATMGNSHDAANVIPTDTGKKLVDRANKKEAEQEKAPMYKKDPAPTKEVNESEVLKTNLINEEIKKMKKIFGYNKKTQ
jgi:hypothetical protein